MFDRTTIEAKGRAGGANGEVGELYLQFGRQLDPKGLQLIGPNERLCFDLPGGGGFGPADQRDPAMAADDRRAGLLTDDKTSEDE